MSSPLEKKSVPAEFKADMDAMSLKGYASVFNNIDSHGDRMMPGSFSETIEEKFSKPATSKIKMFWRHFAPFGMPTALKEDSTGLYFEAKASNTQQNRDRMELIRDGVVDGASIGFNTSEAKRYSEEEGEGAKHQRDILKTDLFEFGPVVWGSNAEGYTEAAKAAREMADELKSGNLLPASEMKALAEHVGALSELLTQLKAQPAPEPTGESKGDEPADDDLNKDVAAFLEGEFFAELRAFNAELRS